MTLAETLQKIKYYPDLTKDSFVIIVVILVGFGAFLVGRYSAIEEQRVGELRIIDTAIGGGKTAYDAPGTISNAPSEAASIGVPTEANSVEVKGMYVGAKSGKTYYLPWCAGVKRIKEENKIWFSSEADALASGYSPTVSCKGM